MAGPLATLSGLTISSGSAYRSRQFGVHPGYAGLGSEIVPFKCNEPAVPTVQQEDNTVRITRWDFAPGAATGWHSHGWPYFVVMLTDAVMKIERDGAVSEVKWKAGDSYQRPAGIEHDVLNASDRPLAFVEIEIKRPEELIQLK